MSNARENVNLLTSADWNIVTLRLANWGAGAVPPQVVLKNNWVAGDGGGLFRYDASDTTTADDSGLVIVDAAGNRWKRQIVEPIYDLRWWPITTTNVNIDNSTAINAAIASVGARGGGIIQFPEAKMGIASTINLGNGSLTQISTINGVVLRGIGSEHAIGYRFSGDRVATTLVWIGAADGRMVDIAGPCEGNALQNLVLDGNEAAGYGLRILSGSMGHFVSLSFYRIKTRHLELNVQQIPDAVLTAANVGFAIRSPADNMFFGLDFDGRTGTSGLGTVLMYFNGWDAKFNDPVRNTFLNTKGIVDLDNNAGLGRAGVAIWMRFVDSNSFIDTWFQSAGTASTPTTASWLYLEGVAPGDGANYPVNNSFSGKLQRGQNLKVTRDATSASPGGNIFAPVGEVDGELVPTWPETKNINGYQPEAVDSDAEINYVSEYGLQRIRDERRNQLLNSGFWRATRGATITTPSANTYTLDNWVVDYDGTPVGLEISQQSFALGQTDVAFEPQYFGRIVVTSASGMTSFSFVQRIENVRRFSGRNCCLSVWAKVSTGTISLTAKVAQNFGTGGSPSTEVVTNCNALDANQTVTTTWQRLRFRFSIPSISGKTLGSNSNSYTSVIFALPLNAGFTLDIAEPQFEYGVADTPWDRNCADIAAEEVLCSRYLRAVNRTANRVYNDFATVTTANLLDSILRFSSMRAAPTLSVSGSASDYQIRDYAGNNGGNCTSNPSIVQVSTDAAILRFTMTTHGLTLGSTGRQESGANGLLLLTAEL